MSIGTVVADADAFRPLDAMNELTIMRLLGHSVDAYGEIDWDAFVYSND